MAASAAAKKNFSNFDVNLTWDECEKKKVPFFTEYLLYAFYFCVLSVSINLSLDASVHRKLLRLISTLERVYDLINSH